MYLSLLNMNVNEWMQIHNKMFYVKVQRTTSLKYLYITNHYKRIIRLEWNFTLGTQCKDNFLKNQLNCFFLITNIPLQPHLNYSVSILTWRENCCQITSMATWHINFFLCNVLLKNKYFLSSELWNIFQIFTDFVWDRKGEVLFTSCQLIILKNMMSGE